MPHFWIVTGASYYHWIITFLATRSKAWRTPMAHQAFDYFCELKHSVTDRHEKIGAIAMHKLDVFIGSNLGKLHVYTISGWLIFFLWLCCRSLLTAAVLCVGPTGKGRRALSHSFSIPAPPKITRLQVVPEWQCLLILAGESCVYVCLAFCCYCCCRRRRCCCDT